MNFAVVDTLGVLKACFALCPFLFAPGYVVGWALDLFEFRHRRPIVRVILAVPLTIAVFSMFSYLLDRFLQPGLWAFYFSVSAVCLLLLAKEVRKTKLASFPKHIWIALGLMMLWVVAAIGSLVDLQIGDRLYSPIVAYDHSTRVAVMAAIARHMPPSNPFFAHPAMPLRYHYLWMLLCSLPLKISHLSARHLMYAGVIWCGLGLMCVVAMGLKFLLGSQTAIARKTLIGVALLCVTGLDILPTLYIAVVGRVWLADMEWWNQAQITSWAASLLWVPHHVVALIACFVGFLLLRHEADANRWRVISVIVAGLAFASAAGLSVYVTFTFVVAIGFWLLALVARKNWKEVAMFVGASAIAVVWALPFLFSLRGSGSGAAFVEFAVRPFDPLGIYFAQKIGFNMQTQSARTLANGILLPINYALELGFFLAVGILRLWQVLRGRIVASANELAAWTLVMASFLIGTFLRSSTISTNDLGFRCFLPAQLVLLLWGAIMLHDWWFDSAARWVRPWLRGALATFMILGILGTAYEVFMIRMSPILYDRWQVADPGWLDTDRQSGKRTYALRRLYESLNEQLPASAVIQHNPATRNSVSHALYSGHDFVAGGLDCGTAFGGDPALCDQRVRRLVALFEFNADSLESTCLDYGIDVMVAKDTDPAWHDPSSWIWSQHPVIANRYVRAFLCGAATTSGAGDSQR